MRGWAKAPGFIHRLQSGGFNGQAECTLLRGFKDATRSPLMAFCSRACQAWIRLQNTVFQPPCLCQVSEFKRLKWTAVLFPSLLEAPIDGLWASAKEETQLVSKRRAPPTTSQARVYTSRCRCFWKQPSLLSAATGVNSQAAEDFLCAKVATFQCGPAVVLLFFLTITFSSPEYSWKLLWRLGAKASYTALSPGATKGSYFCAQKQTSGCWWTGWRTVVQERMGSQLHRVQQTSFRRKKWPKCWTEKSNPCGLALQQMNTVPSTVSPI